MVSENTEKSIFLEFLIIFQFFQIFRFFLVKAFHASPIGFLNFWGFLLSSEVVLRPSEPV